MKRKNDRIRRLILQTIKMLKTFFWEENADMFNKTNLALDLLEAEAIKPKPKTLVILRRLMSLLKKSTKTRR